MEDTPMNDPTTPSTPSPLTFPPSFLTALESPPSSFHPPSNPHATLPASRRSRRNPKQIGIPLHPRTRKVRLLDPSTSTTRPERAFTRHHFLIYRARARGRDLMRKMWRALAAREAEMGMRLGVKAFGLPDTRLRVLRMRFDKGAPVLGGEDGFLREKRILEGGCRDLERVVGELRGEGGGRRFRGGKGEGEGEGEGEGRRSRSV